MSDKYLMNHLMFGSKVINDLFMHGYVESANERVYLCFTKALQEASKLHFDLYKEMEKSGFYNIDNVECSKIKQTEEKLSCLCSECLCKEED